MWCRVEERQRTKPYHGNDDETDALYDDVQSPVEQILAKLLRGQLAAAYEEYDGHGTVKYGVFGLDGPTSGSNIWYKLRSDFGSISGSGKAMLTRPSPTQDARNPKAEHQPLFGKDLQVLVPGFLHFGLRAFLLGAVVLRVFRRECDGHDHTGLIVLLIDTGNRESEEVRRGGMSVER